MVIKINYTTSKCPYCGKLFQENDDIVVCPECGTPMHRECYENYGICANEARHGSYDFDTDPAQGSENNNAVITCPNCGFENPSTAFFCNKCGSNLNISQYKNPTYQTQQPFSNMNGFPNIAIDLTDPLGGIPKDTKFDDDISASEMAKYVKQSTPYYLHVFNNISLFNRSKFNFGAALFSGMYLLYRKMYKIGAIITFIEGAILLLMQYISYFVTTNAKYTGLLSKISNVMNSGGSVQDLVGLVSQLSSQDLFILYLPSILNLCLVAIMITLGFTANRIYFNHCKNEIRKIKSEYNNNQELDNKLQTKGGVNIAIGVTIFICYIAVMYLPSIILGI